MSHIESKDLKIYRITPPPPKWDLQEYIRQYVETGNDKYFYWFLNYYEPQMNYIAKGYRKTYKMEEHFADIKQAMAYGLCKALVNYDISKSPFFPYANRYMEREAHNYIRTMRTGYSIQSEFEYARLRKAMAIYNNLGGKFTEEIISQVAEKSAKATRKQSLSLRAVSSPRTMLMFRGTMMTMNKQLTFFYRIPRSVLKTSISSRSFITSYTKPMIVWNIQKRLCSHNTSAYVLSVSAHITLIKTIWTKTANLKKSQ